MQTFLEKMWYGNSHKAKLLWPLTLAYQNITFLRRLYLQKRQRHFAIPIIVVGNISVGGVGKTPLVIALAKACQQQGLRVGIVSRGYRAKIKRFPHMVSRYDDAAIVGDEPLLLARRTACPVVIAPKRIDAVDFLLREERCDIIISDDGLQHYAMGRTLEIAVIDGQRGLGNGFCLPAGPLRESRKRLQQVDLLVVNQGTWPQAHNMQLKPLAIQQVINDKPIEKEDLQQPVAAVAAIGNPQRFFNTLDDLAIAHKPYAFSDHHPFCPYELQLTENTLIMTEKDAVKCRAFAQDNWYYLSVEANLDESFWRAFWSHETMKGYKHETNTAVSV